jgi:hypothetical protein
MGRFSAAAKRARELTNKQLATEIAALSAAVSRDRLQELLPLKQDKEAFLELMEQVEAETTMDEKLAFLSANLATAGKAALNVLKILA